MLCLGATGTGMAADDGVAVYGELFGGSLDSDTVISGYGALTLPFAQQFGAQVELLADKVGDDDTQNIGGHLYWRNAEVGLLGLIAAHTEYDIEDEDGDFNAWGAEAELYLGPFSLAGHYAWLDSDEAYLDDENYYAMEAHWDSKGAWYAYGGLRGLADDDVAYAELDFTPDAGRSPLTVYGGLTWIDYDSQYLGLSYAVRRTASSDLSLFIEGDNGEDGADGFFIGVTYGAGPVANGPLMSLFDQVTGGF
jgi:hypothetical protein